MLTSWSEVSTPAELSMKSVLSSTPCCARLDAALLGEAEIAALAHDLAAQFVAVDAQRIVGAVADIGVGFRGGLDVGADAAVPQQVDRRLQDGAASVRSASAASTSPAMPSTRAHFLATSGSTSACARTRRRLRRSATCRNPPSSNAAARTCARARRTISAVSGFGSRKMWRWSNAASSRMCRDSNMPLPNTSPDMSPMPTQVKSCVWHVAADRAEVALHRLPRALGGDAHGLVVVADRTAGRERVAQPVAVFDRRCRWRCRRTWRCPCRRRRPDTDRRRRGAPRRAAARPCLRRCCR